MDLAAFAAACGDSCGGDTDWLYEGGGSGGGRSGRQKGACSVVGAKTETGENDEETDEMRRTRNSGCLRAQAPCCGMPGGSCVLQKRFRTLFEGFNAIINEEERGLIDDSLDLSS